MTQSTKLAINGGKPICPEGLKRGRVFGDLEKTAVLEVMDSDVVSRAGRGARVALFEEAFATYHQMPYAVATSSGTSSLHAAVEALGIGPGDEVIVPDLTFVSTASVVMQAGARVVFCDIDNDTFNMSAADLSNKITSATKAVIVVHLYGAPADMDSVSQVARDHGLYVIEDCAQAHGAKFHERIVGTIGDIACFSFYQTKNLSCGEGGMVITRNEALYRRVRSIVRHGLAGDDLSAYDYDKLGYNYAMTELQAAIGLVQLRKLDTLNERRSHNAATYRAELSGLGLHFQTDSPGHVNHYLTATLPSIGVSRDDFLSAVRAEGAMINCLYPLTLSGTRLFGGIPVAPIAARVASSLFNLYVGPGIDEHFIDICCQAVQKTFACYGGS